MSAKGTFASAFAPLVLTFFFSFSADVAEGHNSDDYEKVDDEKTQAAPRVTLETDDDNYESFLPGEPFIGSSSEDEEEADYVNLSSEQNVQVVDITGDNESDYENVTSKEEQLLYINGEADFIYQNMAPEWCEETCM